MTQQQFAPKLGKWIASHWPAEVRIEGDQLRDVISKAGYTLDDHGYVRDDQNRKMLWYSSQNPLRDVFSYFIRPVEDGKVSYAPVSLFANSEDEGRGLSPKARLAEAAGLCVVMEDLPEETVPLLDGQLAFRSEAAEILRDEIAVRQAMLDQLTQPSA